MITRLELAGKARDLGFNLYQAERDYVQHVFLNALYQKTANDFVFKGGTCLQKTMGLDRFSEGLDFTYVGDSAVERVEAVLSFLNPLQPVLSKKQEFEGRSLSFKVKLEGPLYDGRAKRMQHLTLELSLREKPLLPPQARRVVPPYDDVRPYTAYALAANEILAEKIRALMTRNKARDLYDAWFLLQKKARADLETVNEKLACYALRFSGKSFVSAVNDKSNVWASELGVLLKNPPAFAPVAEYVSREISAMLQSE